MKDMIDGQEIKQMSTIGSWYANGNIEVWIDGERHLMHVREIGKMVNEFYFEVEQKKKWKHLKNPVPKHTILCEECGASPPDSDICTEWCV